MATKKLDNVIEIGEDIYEVQAKTSESANTAKQVDNSLTINKKTLTGTTPVVFNGSSAKSVDIVPAGGGAFSGRITVEDLKPSVTDKKSVLNWGEVETKVVEHAIKTLTNSSASFTWNGSVLGSSNPSGVNGLSAILGESSDIASFATRNASAPDSEKLATFIYICTDDHAIYFGTSESATDYFLLSSDKAREAVKLSNARKITVNLAKDATEASFDGTKDIKPKVTGVLDPVNGGTGSTSLANVTVGTSNNLTDPNDARNTVTASDVIQNRDDITSLITGDTTAGYADYADNADMLDGYEATYFQKKITISTSEPSGGSEGDIWIVYKTT